MSANTRLVNLDAMILRADFAVQPSSDKPSYEAISNFGTRDLTRDSPLHSVLRKPDFQRETNHWTPIQVVSLLECFANGDLIPSVILWRSPTYIFVIDGRHRLSALRAWIEDDYGDGPLSQQFFGSAISAQQRQAANETRKQVQARVGTWQHMQAMIKAGSQSPEIATRFITISARALAIQWVQGDADKAEASFFKINTKGTPLDDIEQLLLSNRRKPIPISARAVIRAAQGHKYWSSFSRINQEKIEKLATELHHSLFEPEVKTPIKTLDLPLGGAKGFRTALDVLIQFVLFANQNHLGSPKAVSEQEDDMTGEQTVHVLQQALALASRITGNDSGSLGLHPAIYFYGPSGRHVSYLFLGTAHLFSRKLANNDKSFFMKLTRVRKKLETLLIVHKDLVSTILQKTGSNRRVSNYSNFLGKVIDRIDQGEDVSAQDFVTDAGLVGKIVVGDEPSPSPDFSEEVKSSVFLRAALKTALKCPICEGYLDPQKSISYDHITEKSKGGDGSEDNLQITHPYCNQAVKNRLSQTHVNE